MLCCTEEAAAVFKCQDSAKKVIYQDTPCPDGNKMSTANLPMTQSEIDANAVEQRRKEMKLRKKELEQQKAAAENRKWQFDETRDQAFLERRQGQEGRRQRALSAVDDLKVGDYLSESLSSVDPKWRAFLTDVSIMESRNGTMTRYVLAET